MNNTIDITKLDVVTLKAYAYDELAKIESAQRNLKIINDTLASKEAEHIPQEPKVEEEKKD